MMAHILRLTVWEWHKLRRRARCRGYCWQLS